MKTTLAKQSGELKHIASQFEEKLDFKATLDRILLDKTHWFDLYKQKKDKLALLNEAVRSQDGNAILAVVLFLRRTLLPGVFYEILLDNAQAFSHYASYLEQLSDSNGLAELYGYQKKFSEAAALTYVKAIVCDSDRDLSEKIQLFTDFEKKASQSEISPNGIAYLTASKYMLLAKIQKEILRNKSSFLRKEENKQNAIDFLFGNTLYYTLAFCLKYSKEMSDNEMYSVENFKKKFEMSAKEFAIVYIKSMAEAGMWTHLEGFVNQRGLFNMVQKNTVPYETIVYMIYKLKVHPGEQLKKYLFLTNILKACHFFKNCVQYLVYE